MEYKNLPDMAGWAALRAVVEYGGVTEAAKKLKVGQPAVTKRLRVLEDCYGMALVERIGGRLRLTAAGEKVYAMAVETLDRQWALREELRRLERGETTLRLEVSFAIAEHLLPDYLVRFAKRFSNYKIDSSVGYSRKIQTHVATGLTDLALMETAPDHPDILVQKWKDDELWLVCGPKHPLAQVGHVGVEHLSELSYVLRERRSAVRETLEEALHAVGISKLPVALEVGSTDAIMEILMLEPHVSLLPRFVVADRVARGRLARIEISNFRIPMQLWIARHRSKLDHPVAEAFIKLLRE